MLVYKEYNRARAVEYAKRWALSRNPLFTNFAGRGGDCTNFVSQCIFAGCCQMNFTPDFGWYYINENMRAPAWSSVEFLFRFLTENKTKGPSAIQSTVDQLYVGDLIQLGNEDHKFYHTLIVTKISPQILVCAHSYDALNRPLLSYDYKIARGIHIKHVIA